MIDALEVTSNSTAAPDITGKAEHVRKLAMGPKSARDAYCGTRVETMGLDPSVPLVPDSNDSISGIEMVDVVFVPSEVMNSK